MVDSANAEAVRPSLDSCRCDLRTRLLGDGCQFCNPDLHAWIEEQNRIEDAKETSNAK